MDKIYLCIDLKSFYASVECVERGLDPLTTNLVVADQSRTDKTICLAVTPSLKKYGISGRARLYEVKQKVKEINQARKKKCMSFVGKSHLDFELEKNEDLELDFLIAPPRMRYYMQYSSNIYQIYLNYFSVEDIYVYSIDEVFCDITSYLSLYQMSPTELATKVIQNVYEQTGITATAGIGTNLFLAKVAMDIVAKHKEANEFGVRIAELDENSYRRELWSHRPLIDFWRVGKGTANKLQKNGMFTMGDIALKSIENENLLYRLFGVNAELLIDHAWGWEPCTLEDIWSYHPSSKSLSSSQVLSEPYCFEKAQVIVKEMMELLTLELVEKHYVTDQIVLTIGYDVENINHGYQGEISLDFYGRKIPKHAHGTIRLDYPTSSTKILSKEIISLYQKIVSPDLLIRRIGIAAGNLKKVEEKETIQITEQFQLFSDTTESIEKDYAREEEERKVQKAILEIKKKYGKNSILKGLNLLEGGTTIERNNQVGGHRG